MPTASHKYLPQHSQCADQRLRYPQPRAVVLQLFLWDNRLNKMATAKKSLMEFTQKITALREKYVDDSVSQKDIDQYETDIQKLFKESDLKNHPVFKSIFEDAEKRMNEINALLMNDKTLTDVQRSSLFSQRDIWQFIFKRFSMKTHDDALDAMKALLDSKIEQ